MFLCTTEDPQPTDHCPRLNGFFHHENTSVCNKFYYCVDGKFNMITCPEGLVYNQGTGTCLWPDEAKKKGCTSEGMYVLNVDLFVNMFAGEFHQPSHYEVCDSNIPSSIMYM